jgi:DtxR family Mn-dependent transcriptional regulator
MGSTAAHEMACRLEHATSEALAERLASFLSHPRVCPEGDPIPDSSSSLPTTHAHPLVETRAGQRGHCVRCTADEASCAFLAGQGLRPGVAFQVVATAPDSLLLDLDGRRIALDRSLATAILVEIEEEQPSRIA